MVSICAVSDRSMYITSFTILKKGNILKYSKSVLMFELKTQATKLHG